MTTRRDLLGGLAATALLPALPARARTTTATMPALIAGTYANEGGAGLYTLAPAGAGWRVAAPAPLTGISFGVTHGAHRYLAKEQAKGRLIVTDRNARVLADVRRFIDAYVASHPTSANRVRFLEYDSL